MKTIKEIFDLDEKRTKGGDWYFNQFPMKDGGSNMPRIQMSLNPGITTIAEVSRDSNDANNAQYIGAMPDAVKHLRLLSGELAWLQGCLEGLLEGKDGQPCDCITNNSGVSIELRIAVNKIKNALQLNEACDE